MKIALIHSILLILGLVAYSPAEEYVQTIEVNLQLRSGGAITGLVVEFNHHGLVVARDKIPYVFAWKELESSSAYQVRKKLRVHENGYRENLSARDHFEMGLFSLGIDRFDLANMDFQHAGKMDRKYKLRSQQALQEYRNQPKSEKRAEDPFDLYESIESIESIEVDKSKAHDQSATPDTGISVFVPSNLPGQEIRDRILETYYTFGEKVREVIGKDVVLIETDHFLIWTDWEYRNRAKLSRWCETMYESLMDQFQLERGKDIFLAKCPIYCWRTKARFKKFARYFDGYDGINALGYTRSIEKNGHVHVVLVRTGKTTDDFDRFASTLVHEGTHAFIHRLYSNRLIPHWINEGFADLMAERVLGDRSYTGENAALLAKPYVRYDWPISDMLLSTDPIGVEQYPLAHSLVAYLQNRERNSFVRLMGDLKQGDSFVTALSRNYNGLTIEQLDRQWRNAVRSLEWVDGQEAENSQSPRVKKH